MNTSNQLYRGYRFPSKIISHAIWLYHRFCPSFRDIEHPAEGRPNDVVLVYAKTDDAPGKLIHDGPVVDRQDATNNILV